MSSTSGNSKMNACTTKKKKKLKKNCVTDMLRKERKWNHMETNVYKSQKAFKSLKQKYEQGAKSSS